MEHQLFRLILDLLRRLGKGRKRPRDQFSDDEILRVDGALSGTIDLADLDYPAILDRDVGMHAGRARTVDDSAIANHEIVGHDAFSPESLREGSIRK